MFLAGLQKLTLLDYPGKTACIVFTPGCNFRCPFCHNPELIDGKWKMEDGRGAIAEETFFSRLQTRQGLLDGVSICGGEPTLQSDLYDFCTKVKQMGFLVKLDTNGRDATILERLLQDKLVDYVAIDAKYPQDKLKHLVGVPLDPGFFINYQCCRGLLKNSNICYEYRTTVIKGYHTSADIEVIARSLEGCQAYFLQNYRAGNTLDPAFDGRSFTDAELEELCAVARPYVGSVKWRM